MTNQEELALVTGILCISIPFNWFFIYRTIKEYELFQDFKLAFYVNAFAAPFGTFMIIWNLFSLARY